MLREEFGEDMATALRNRLGERIVFRCDDGTLTVVREG